MILVVGLVVAGLVGIAAAFYFSIRSGHGGSKRLRSGGSGRAGAIDAREAEATAPLDPTEPTMAAAPQMAADRRMAAGPPIPPLGITGLKTAPGRIPFWISRPMGPRAETGQPGRADAWASAREPTSMRSCGRRRRSAALATSSSGMTWRRTSRSPRPHAPPIRIQGPGTGRSLRCRGRPRSPSRRCRRLRRCRQAQKMPPRSRSPEDAAGPEDAAARRCRQPEDAARPRRCRPCQQCRRPRTSRRRCRPRPSLSRSPPAPADR